MANTTATEQDVRNARAGAYVDGVDMGMSHVLDALASGLTVGEAIAYAKRMGQAAAENIISDARNRVVIREKREAVRSNHGVMAGACAASHYGRKLA